MNKISLVFAAAILSAASFAQTNYGSSTINQTNSSTPTIFKNNGTELMRIQPNGNVGIGTTAPSEKLEVIGNLKVSGTITSSGTGTTTMPNAKISDKLLFGPNDEVSLKFVPAAANTPEIMTFGKLPPANFVPSLQCTFPKLPNSVLNVFPGMLYSFGNNANNNLNMMSMGYDGANAIIDIAGEVSQSGNPGLLINWYCGKDVYMCTGSNGGYVQTGPHFEVGGGNVTRDFDIAANILGSTRIKYAGSHSNIFEVLDGSNDAKFLVSQGGNVGIGTTSSNFKLDVASGDVRIRGINNFSSPNDEAVLYIGDNTHYIKSVFAGGLRLGTNGAPDAIAIEQSTGEIGIGTTTPGYKLDVRGVISNGGADFILGKNDGRAQGNNTANRALVHDDNDVLVINYGNDFEGGVNIVGSLFINNSQLTSSQWTSVNTNDINYSAGKVGIGITNMPGDYKLYVADGILTEKVKVAVKTSSDWMDHVFNVNYDLMSLNNLKSYIEINKHLPGIPSAEEVVNTGIDVAKMEALLLGKIEELTLYILLQEEKINALNEKIILISK